MFCQRCGSQVGDGDSYCPRCGESLTGSAAPKPLGAGGGPAGPRASGEKLIGGLKGTFPSNQSRVDDVPIELYFTDRKVIELTGNSYSLGGMLGGVNWATAAPEHDSNDLADLLKNASSSVLVEKVREVSLKRGGFLEKDRCILKVNAGLLHKYVVKMPLSELESAKSLILRTPLAQRLKSD